MDWTEEDRPPLEPGPSPASGSVEDFSTDSDPPPQFPNSGCLKRAPDIRDAQEFHPLGETLNREAEITEDIARRLLANGPFCLTSAKDCSFSGSGVYCLEGPVPLHEPLWGILYIGKSQHKGRRKGLDTEGGCALSGRLKRHLRSITQTSINPEDVNFRFLVLPTQWVSFAEHKLIELFRPVWNVCLDGFGNNPQGSRRATQESSAWDTWYPGRVVGTIPRDRDLVLKRLEEHLPQCLRQARQACEKVLPESNHAQPNHQPSNPIGGQPPDAAPKPQCCEAVKTVLCC